MSQLHGIQALRAVAALMVAVHHVQPEAAAIAQRAGTTFSPSTLLPWMAGVDIFFVVSGFIMVHASAGLLGRPDGARLFIGRRIARIVPLYWAATTLVLLVGLAAPAVLNSGAPTFAQIAGSYLFWPVVSTQGLVQPLYSLGWTLNFEMLFYGLFAAGLLLPPRWTLPFVGLSLAGLVAAGWAASGRLPLPFGFWSQPIMLDFIAGMGIAVLRRRGFRLSAGLRVAVALLGGLVLMVAAQIVDGDTPWMATAWRGSAATLLVTAAGCGERRSAPALPTRMLAALGGASYALYLAHPFVIRGLRELILRLGVVEPMAFSMLALLACIVVALLVHRLIERRATAWLRARLGV